MIQLIYQSKYWDSFNMDLYLRYLESKITKQDINP